jgi:hypothetical protein
LFDEFNLTLSSGLRTEILGPVLSFERQETEDTVAVPPLFSLRRDKTTDFSEMDVLYPLITYHRFGLEYRFQVVQLFSFSGGQSMADEAKHRFTLFPFYFQQRSPNPEDNYTAVVPFYGRIKNRFFRDDIFFIMLPAYLESRKRDVVTKNYLVPIFDVRHGDGLTGWQVWPLVEVEHKVVTTQTNLYNEVETIGGHEKLSILWPIFFKNDLGIGTTNLEIQRLVLPFYSSQRSPMRDSTSYLWPVGYTHSVDREKKYEEWACPWPFIDFARGEGKSLNRVFPFFSQGRTPNLQSDFYLWPIFKYNRVQAEPLDRQRTRILFYLYSDLIERNTTAGTMMHRTDLWPLFTARHDADGNQRLQLLAPLETILPGNTAVERNYSPIWSIWRSEKNAGTGVSSYSFLWNLYRLETGPGTRKCSLLLGLIHYQSGPEGKRWRLLYIPFGTKAGQVSASPNQ